MFWIFLIGFAVIYATQTVLALKQAKDFTRTFTALHRRGKVAIGKKKGLLTAGAIVMFLLDDAGGIAEGHRLNGVTVFARFRRWGAFDGADLISVAPETDRRFPRSVRQAVANARDNYRIVLTGGRPPEPPGPLTQIADRLRVVVRRSSRAQAAGG
ncbi:transcriptional regulator GutM [Propionicicella superfundia]|uniref:transcriptional regulator GutM n=1 Tax=Propionicicella superfundia TaxID=348582 RepID=UPI00040AFDF5|nr:transcriptional regulator GutM [Propionicicella superfundia]